MSINIKTIATVLGAFVLGVITWHTGMLVETAYAAFPVPITPGSGVVPTGSLGDVLEKLVGYIAFINSFMHILLLIILQFLQYLLQADFFNDPVMMNGLFTIWKLARDIMNIIFAIALIGVSFYVIITAKTDMIKEKIAHFVIAVILVNFSWFFPRVIIDVANVLTATVYSIPNMLPTGGTCMMLAPEGGTTPCKVVSAILIFPGNKAEMDNWCSTNAGAASGTPSCPCIDGLECHVLEDYETARERMKPTHAMINGMAVSFVKITELATVPTGSIPAGLGTADAIKTSLRIGLSIMLAFLVQIAVVLPLIGMAIGFLIRIIILWMTTAFMPFAFLGYMKSGKLGISEFGFEIDIWKEFITAAFLPATVGIPLVVGFIMLTTVAAVPAPSGMPFDLGIPMISGVTSWWAMLWVFAAIGIIWKGCFSALKKSEIIGNITEKLRATGESVAGGIARLPLLTPIPLPGLPNANLGSVVNAPRFLADAVRTSASGYSGKSFTDTVKERFGGAAAGGGAPGGVDTVELARKLKTASHGDALLIVDAIKNKLGTADEAAGMQAIKEALGRMGHAGLNDHDSLTVLQQTAAHHTGTDALSGADIKEKIREALTRL